LRHFNTLKNLTLLLIIITLGYCLVASEPRAIAADDVLLWIDPPTQAAGEGENFTISIIVANLPSPNGAFGFEFVLTWDRAIVTGISVTDVLFQSIAPPDSPRAENVWRLKAAVNNTEGSAWYAYTFQDLFLARDEGYAPISGNHTLAIVTLTGASTGWSTFSFSKIVVGGYDFDTGLAPQLPSTGVGGTVVIGNPPPVIEVISPQNASNIKTNAVNLTVAVSKPVSWIAYSLDGAANVTIPTNTIVLQMSDGQHNIIVYATDTVGQTGSSDKTYFKVDATPPTALYTTAPPTPQAELFRGTFRWNFLFNASTSYDQVSGIADYFWSFGDGANASGVAVIHAYNEPGTYNVILTVTDNAGNSAAKSNTFDISPASQPMDIPWGLIGAIIIPAAWVPALFYYRMRMKRKKKKV
jgi:PKD repeat protein